MHTFRMLVLVAALGSGACAQDAGTLAGATRALGATDLKSIEYSGTGQVVPVRPGAEPDAAVAGVRRQQLHGQRQLRDAGRARADGRASRSSSPGARGPRRWSSGPVQVVSGTHAWNLARAGRRRAGRAPAPQPQPAAVEERTMEIWTTPHGFLKAAAANNATSQPVGRRAPRSRSPWTASTGTSAASTRRTRSSACRRGSTTRARRHAGRDRLLGLPRLRRRACSRRASCGRRAAIPCSTSPSRRSPRTRRSTSRCPTRCAASRRPPVDGRRSRSSPTASTT